MALMQRLVSKDFRRKERRDGENRSDLSGYNLVFVNRLDKLNMQYNSTFIFYPVNPVIFF